MVAMVTALVVFLVIRLAQLVRNLVARHAYLLITGACLLVGAVAIVFAEVTGQSAEAVLFSGQDAMSSVVRQAGSLSIATLALLLFSKAVAWGVSMGAARGGPTFPAVFLGLVGGLLCGHPPALRDHLRPGHHWGRRRRRSAHHRRRCRRLHLHSWAGGAQSRRSGSGGARCRLEKSPPAGARALTGTGPRACR